MNGGDYRQDIPTWAVDSAPILDNEFRPTGNRTWKYSDDENGTADSPLHAMYASAWEAVSISEEFSMSLMFLSSKPGFIPCHNSLR